MLRAYQTFWCVLALVAGSTCLAGEQYPKKIEAPGGDVILHEAWAERFQTAGVAHARRVGDTLYVSGMIVHRADGEGNDPVALKLQSRRTLEQLKGVLEAWGASFQDIVMINSFHVWEGPNFRGTPIEQFKTFVEVLREFMEPPYAAWTAVGTSGLLDPRGIIEVQFIVRVPPK